MTAHSIQRLITSLGRCMCYSKVKATSMRQRRVLKEQFLKIMLFLSFRPGTTRRVNKSQTEHKQRKTESQ